MIAVPVGPVACPAIMPPPTNCLASYREGTAIVLSVLDVAVSVTTILVASTAGRRRPALVKAGIVVLGLMLLAVWPAIGWLPGFPLSGS